MGKGKAPQSRKPSKPAKTTPRPPPPQCSNHTQKQPPPHSEDGGNNSSADIDASPSVHPHGKGKSTLDNDAIHLLILLDTGKPVQKRKRGGSDVAALTEAKPTSKKVRGPKSGKSTQAAVVVESDSASNNNSGDSSEEEVYDDHVGGSENKAEEEVSFFFVE